MNPSLKSVCACSSRWPMRMASFMAIASGNLLILEDGRIGLIDFGLVVE